MSGRIALAMALIGSGLSLGIAGLFGAQIAEGQPLGIIISIVAILVLLDGIKIAIPNWMKGASLSWPLWIGAVLAVVLLSAVSFTATFAVYEKLTSDTAASLAAEHQKLRDLRSAKIAWETELASLGDAQILAVAEKNLERHRWAPEWAASDRCAQPTKNSRIARFCARNSNLEAALETARTADDLRKKVDGARSAILASTTAGAMKAGASGLAALLQVLGFSDNTAAQGEARKGVALAAIVELLSLILLPLARAFAASKVSRGTGEGDTGTVSRDAALTPAGTSPGLTTGTPDGTPSGPPSGTPPRRRSSKRAGRKVLGVPTPEKSGVGHPPSSSTGRPGTNVIPLVPRPGQGPSRSVTDFLAGMSCEPGHWHSSSAIGTAYKNWCARSGDTPVPPTRFYVELQSLGFRRHHNYKGRFYIDERHLLAQSA